MIEKLKTQIEAVLKGEAKLLEAAHNFNLNTDAVEQRIRETMAKGVIFEGDHFSDVLMAGYWRGRQDQFIASMVNLFGKEEFQTAYSQVCLKLGISPKKLN